MAEISADRIESSPYNDIISRASQAYNVEPELIKAIIGTESSGNPEVVSSKGAGGLMQLMPETAKELGVKDSSDPEQNIMGGAKYLRQMLDKFGGNETLALAAYNAGPGSVAKYGGVPPFPETQNYIDSILNYKKTTSPTSTTGFEISADRVRVADEKETHSVWQNIYQKARPFIEPGAVGLGMAGGGMIGFAAPVPGGAAIGGALGYAGAEEFIDALDKTFGIKEGGSLPEELWEGIYNVAMGAAFETISPILGNVGKGILKTAQKTGVAKIFKDIKELFPHLSDKGRLVKARNILKDLRKKTPETIKTTEETEKLLKRTRITEVPTHAQKTGSIEEAAFEQAKAAQKPKIMEVFKARDARISEQGLENIQGQFKGDKTIGEAIAGVRKESGRLKFEAERLTGKTESALAKLRAATKEKEVIGENIYATVRGAKEGAKKIHENIYAKIPGETKISNVPIRKALKETLDDIKKVGGSKDTSPNAIIGQIKKELVSKPHKPSGLLGATGKPIETKSIQKTEISFAKLQDWKSQIGEEVRASMKGPTPNLKRVRRLKMLEDGIHKTLEQMRGFSGSQAQIAKDYKKATAAFKKYHDVYRKGPVDKILGYGYETTGLQTLKSDMPSKFFQHGKAELADDLINAIGLRKARKLIKPYSETLFLTNATEAGTLKVPVAKKWLSNHADVLKKYGLYKDFEKIVKSGEISLQATKRLKDYQTTIVSTILKTDVDKMMGKIFSGTGKTASKETAKELLEIPGIKNNNVAIKGIQNSFKKFLLKEMENSGIDVLSNPIRSIAKSKKLLETYKPAMEVLYKDSPQKIKAFEDYHKIMEMIARNKNITYAGGSTTVEKATGGAAKESWSKMLESAATLVAIRQGSGWVWSATRNFTKAVLGAPWKISKEEIDKILTEALLNPEAAQTLMSMTKGTSKQIIEKQLKYHIAAGKAMSAKKAIDSLRNKKDEEQ